jgi:peptidoglycan hydrolase-like protein with peptidoglycan-binding domain
MAKINAADLKNQTFDRIMHADAPIGKLARGQTSVSRMAFNRIKRNPSKALSIILLSGAGFLVFGNIMLMQPERHRAPMFVGNPLIHATPQPAQVTLPPARPGSALKEIENARRAELIRDLQLELASRGYFTGEPDPKAEAKTVQAIREFQGVAKLPVDGVISEATLAAIITSNARGKNQIAAVLSASADRLERPETVVAIQRALTKLNYGNLRDDGTMGAGTRAALDRFVKDRKLPPLADAQTRVLRELSAAAGIAIE